MKLNLLFLSLIAVCVSCGSSKKSADTATETAVHDLPINTEGGAEEVMMSVEAPSDRVAQRSFWERKSSSALPKGEKRIEPKAFEGYACAYDQLTAELDQGATSIFLPTLEGMVSFTIENSNTMSPALAEKFPNIRSYKGRSDNGALHLRLDTNDEGLFAEISGTGRKELIAPLFKSDTEHYAVYKEEDSTGGTPRDDSYE